MIDQTFTSTHNCLEGCNADSPADSPTPVGKEAEPEPNGLAITADLNGDGYPDVVTGTHVFLNPGNGDFHNVTGQRYWDAAIMGANVTVIAGVDVDSDGDVDLVVATDDPTGAKVLINPGSGLISSAMELNGWWGDHLGVVPTGGSGGASEGMVPFGVDDVTSLTALDVNNDGHMDLVVGRAADRQYCSPPSAPPPSPPVCCSNTCEEASDGHCQDSTP